jgi:hypothetical protein
MKQLAFLTPTLRAVGAVAALAVVLLSGCATTPTPGGMVPAQVAVAKHHTGKLAVTATSLSDSAAPAQPGVKTGGALIAEAIVASVQQSKLFSQVVPRGDAQFVLAATLITNETPPWGGTLTARCEMGWVLTRSDGTAVWKELLTSEGTATGGDAFVGMQRAQIARERAIRENIAQAMTRIGALDLPR